MKINLFLPFFLTLCLSLLGEIEHSIIPLMDQTCMDDLQGKVNAQQIEKMHSISRSYGNKLRVMSFNMLFNLPKPELELDPENRWENRKGRLIEYLQEANADLIGSQELQQDQLDEVMDTLGDMYDYYGDSAGGMAGAEILAVFYRKDRLKLLEAETYYYSETPCVVSENPLGYKNAVTFCRFCDLKTNKNFAILNTHLAFAPVEERHYEACLLRYFINTLDINTPLFVVGDYNTFPFRQ